MAKFITESELNHEIEQIFKKANSTIFLVSPYIKLHSRIESVLQSKKSDYEIQIFLLFGKNKENPTLSMRHEDLKFFMDFPNIEIRYNERLHAKYYANEFNGILTSMNLHSFSQDNNIEFGVLTKTNLIKGVISSVVGDGGVDEYAWEFFQEIFRQSEPIFKKSPVFESAMLGLKKIYKSSNIEFDNTNEFFQASKFSQKAPIKGPNFKPLSKPSGYCIRTGKAIQFNPDRPLSEEAYKSWSQFSNKDYPEKFCHFSGEPSNGETTFSKPILRKNWSKAKEIHAI